MKTFPLEVVTREQAFPLRDAVSIDVPATEGRLTVLAGHAPLVCLLRDGDVTIGLPDGERERWRVTGGIMTVDRKQVTLLAHGVSRAEQDAADG